MRNIEIEQRFITNQQQVLIDWLEDNAKMLSCNYYHDIYFQSHQDPFTTIDKNGLKDAHKWLRIRKCKDSSNLCYKSWHRDSLNDIPLYAEQIEVNIDNPNNMQILLERLGYYPIAEVYKWRTSWSYNEYIIVQDKVKDLGIFYEIEYIENIPDPYIAIKSIFHLLQTIGISDFKIIDKGYPWMYWNSNWKNILNIE